MILQVVLKQSFPDFMLDVALTAASGVTAVFGPSGSGKTTIINMISGLSYPDAGRIVLGDTVLTDTATKIDVPVHKRRIGYVFQDGRLFPHLSVSRNIRFGSRFAGAGALTHEADVIDLLGIGPLMDRLPTALSGGEQQRVALARALLSSPELLLMDEPLTALDGPRKDEILPYLEALRDETDLPILYVSHSVDEVARLASQLIILQDGKVQLSGSTADVLANPVTLPFIGIREACSILRAKVENHDPDGLAELSVPGGKLVLPGVTSKVGETLTIRILAQDVLVALERPVGLSSRNILSVTITDIHRGDGPGVVVTLQLGDQRILARITARAADELNLRSGLACYAILKATTVSRGSIGRAAASVAVK